MRSATDSESAPALHTAPAGPAAPRIVLRALQAVVSPAGLTGGITELALTGAHLLMYPLGTRTEPLRAGDDRVRRGAPPVVRARFAADPLAARTPVLLVHGLADNRSVFAVMRHGLRRRGFEAVSTWNYSPRLDDVARGAADLGRHLERLCEQSGHERVHVVGHSLGGLIARYHLQRQDGARHMHDLVTLGTPHAGTVLARLGPTPLIRQLRPASPLISELAEPAPGWRTPVTAIYSDLDQLVIPTRAARWDHPDIPARNVLVRGVGHTSLPFSRVVLDEVADTLAGLRAPASAVRMTFSAA